MLNISKNDIRNKVDISKYEAVGKTKMAKANKMFSWWLFITLVIIIIISFLPWTQNIQMKGKVTTLSPEHRPQTVHSAIAGRIEHWYVQEGDLVDRGDTILFLSEVKAEYFDPELVQRTANQVEAKRASIVTYDQKANALANQISAMRAELGQKKEQLRNKIKQSELKILSADADLSQAKVDYDIAEYQLRRADTLYQQGVKSLTDLEGKKIKVQETQAKLISAENKLRESEAELATVESQYANLDNEYNNKIAKAQSDRFSAITSRLDAEGSLNKMSNELANYERRNELYYVIAPQKGYITQAITPGIGEIVKEGEPIISIVPSDFQLAVELFVRPMDLPLIHKGEEVRFIFDGWPAFIFSGWPNASVGTFSGEIVAIDNIPNSSDKYRILVAGNDSNKPWPELLRVGSGAEGIALLNNVPLWYEIWRQLNGFPPNFYENDLKPKDDPFASPVRKVAK